MPACTRYFDAEGTAIASTVNDRVIAIDLPELAKIPTVVGVAAGAYKVEGVHGALMGQVIDVLIIDRGCVDVVKSSYSLNITTGSAYF